MANNLVAAAERPVVMQITTVLYTEKYVGHTPGGTQRKPLARLLAH